MKFFRKVILLLLILSISTVNIKSDDYSASSEKENLFDRKHNRITREASKIVSSDSIYKSELMKIKNADYFNATKTGIAVGLIQTILLSFYIWKTRDKRSDVFNLIGETYCCIGSIIILPDLIIWTSIRNENYSTNLSKRYKDKIIRERTKQTMRYYQGWKLIGLSPFLIVSAIFYVYIVYGLMTIQF